jgi:hypothetical protein
VQRVFHLDENRHRAAVMSCQMYAVRGRMVGVRTNDEAHSLFIVGHGINVRSSFELESGIFVEPIIP